MTGTPPTRRKKEEETRGGPVMIQHDAKEGKGNAAIKAETKDAKRVAEATRFDSTFVGGEKKESVNAAADVVDLTTTTTTTREEEEKKTKAGRALAQPPKVHPENPAPAT